MSREFDKYWALWLVKIVWQKMSGEHTCNSVWFEAWAMGAFLERWELNGLTELICISPRWRDRLSFHSDKKKKYKAIEAWGSTICSRIWKYSRYTWEGLPKCGNGQREIWWDRKSHFKMADPNSNNSEGFHTSDFSIPNI